MLVITKGLDRISSLSIVQGVNSQLQRFFVGILIKMSCKRTLSLHLHNINLKNRPLYQREGSNIEVGQKSMTGTYSSSHDPHALDEYIKNAYFYA